ncbi:uncharacterized protein LOC110874900 [Helianthus annuus]|uniref:uncharacterized protein LOC110874900 n=1 Tax=Helianthus annuus TaxID=4232 RepID=UPI00165326E3|nr:uncharacterized protein LOC110874900 [Helianthus annuus]
MGFSPPCPPPSPPRPPFPPTPSSSQTATTRRPRRPTRRQNKDPISCYLSQFFYIFNSLPSSSSPLQCTSVDLQPHLCPTSVDLQSTAIIVSPETPIVAITTVRSHHDRSQQPPSMNNSQSEAEQATAQAKAEALEKTSQLMEQASNAAQSA